MTQQHIEQLSREEFEEFLQGERKHVTDAQVYESVPGTSTNSRYHVISAYAGGQLKLCYRYLPNSSECSLRLWVSDSYEASSELQYALISAGLTSKDGGHWSLHVPSANKMQAAILAGGFILMLSFHVGMDTPIPTRLMEVKQ